MRRTATSRTSFWLLLVHCRAFRIGGSLAVSNLTGKYVSYDRLRGRKLQWSWVTELGTDRRRRHQ